MDLQLGVLGPVQAWSGGAEIPLGPPQQRAFLAMLVLGGGRIVPVSEIAAGLWGLEPPPRAIGTIRTYASRLRQVLPGVSYRDGGYQIVLPAGSLDLAEFEDRAGRGDHAGALSLVRGEPLSGLPGPYAERQRARLAELLAGVTEARISADLAAGRHELLIPELTALAAADPLRERASALLMLALYRSGRQADALAVYEHTRRVLADELGCDPGPELQDLHRQVLMAEVPAVAAASAGPAQLPMAPAELVGRDEPLAVVAGRLAEPGTTVTAISGPGGVGKTALALAAAHIARGEYPDGQLYADLLGAEAQPAEPGAILADFLRALGAAVPESLGARAAAYRSALAGRRMLVVLDNARDAAQVAPLLPAAGAVLVTSRVRLDELPGTCVVELAALGRADAVELLGRIAGPERIAAEPGASTAVAAACADLPLAVRVAGARLAKRPRWTVAALAERLADESGRLDQLRAGALDVEAALAVGYQQLDPDTAWAFRMLSVAPPADLGLDAAAALLDRTAAETENLLETLVDANMLRTPAAGQYGFHDLLRLYARRCGKREDLPEERSAALDRLLDHYLGGSAGVVGIVGGVGAEQDHRSGWSGLPVRAALNVH
ncbi:AfsR/SARP family transcriptional regulator [Longispora albida]|uniref:AfsR/SARP family transcriptional regulator n=1 Tax=Longispora albida TaxID=203523 RepID=UPI00039EB752|nr:BTAD domain-containing putative transcriptional regulator [Longispora albida]